MEKQNLTQQKHAFINQNKWTTTQNKHKELKSGLVASYDIWLGKGEGLFSFWHFINLSLNSLDTYPLSYSSGIHTRHETTDMGLVRRVVYLFMSQLSSATHCVY